jgi:hypothetical protein
VIENSRLGFVTMVLLRGCQGLVEAPLQGPQLGGHRICRKQCGEDRFLAGVEEHLAAWRLTRAARAQSACRDPAGYTPGAPVARDTPSIISDGGHSRQLWFSVTRSAISDDPTVLGQPHEEGGEKGCPASPLSSCAAHFAEN